MKNLQLSKRNFKIICFDGLEEVNQFDMSIAEIIDDELHDTLNGTELMYSLQEEIDPILDMKVGDQIVVSIDRNNLNEKGLLIRNK